jgi:hypothetical protein
MLPADTIAEITTNLAALQLAPDTAAQILAAVLTPLMRTAEPPQATPPSQPSRRPRSSKRSRSSTRKRKYKRHAPTEAHDRAIAALKANPGASTTELAKVAKVSRATVVKARNEIAKAERKRARKAARETSKLAPADRRQRAQHFLREQLSCGAKPASAVEEAATKAHVDLQTLEQARADLGIVTSRANTGGAQAVQWSLPG